MEPVEAHYTRQIQKQNKTIYIYIFVFAPDNKASGCEICLR